MKHIHCIIRKSDGQVLQFGNMERALMVEQFELMKLSSPSGVILHTSAKQLSLPGKEKSLEAPKGLEGDPDVRLVGSRKAAASFVPSIRRPTNAVWDSEAEVFALTGETVWPADEKEAIRFIGKSLESSKSVGESLILRHARSTIYKMLQAREIYDISSQLASSQLKGQILEYESSALLYASRASQASDKMEVANALAEFKRLVTPF